MERRRISNIRAFGGRDWKTSRIGRDTRLTVLYLCFADQHYRYVVADRVDTVALAALESFVIMYQRQLSLAKRAD